MNSQAIAYSLLLLVGLFWSIDVAAADGIGDRLLRTFGVFEPLPLSASAALTAGWTKVSTSCVPSLGWAYATTSQGPTQEDPMWLFFTQAGQLGGFVNPL
jgi:hypothetical protein